MISILFVAKNSVYKTMTDSVGEPLDCWDEERDAMKWPGGNPIVAHPPCRLFCKLKHLSTAPKSEKHLAHFAVQKVREFGGVLEHPAHSSLWKEAGLPRPGRYDEYGGFTFSVDQFWFGHQARKATWLYVFGTTPRDLPDTTLRFGYAEDIWGGKDRPTNGGRWSGARSATPPAFARWLVDTAERCIMPNARATRSSNRNQSGGIYPALF